MNRKREAIFMGIGVLAGLVLSGPTAKATPSITATLSDQPIYVNGQRVAMTAYHIGGNNYVRLRDIGRAVDFDVTYDAATNSVYIDRTKPYQKEIAPAIPGTVTEKSVQAVLAGLRERYPHGTVYPTPYRSTSNGPYRRGTYCSGWATLCSDAAFGDLPWQYISNPRWDEIRPGDLVAYDNAYGGHVIVVVSKTDDTIFFTDSGTTQKVYWGGSYPRWWMEQQPGYTLYTRYPQ